MPQARIYRVYHAPPGATTALQRLELLAERAERLAQRAPRSRGWSTTRSWRPPSRRPCIDERARQPVRRHRDRQAGRGSRARSSARSTPWSRELLAAGPDRRRTAARAQPHPGRLRARHRAAGRLRRPLRHPGREHDLRRHGRRVPGPARARSPRRRRRDVRATGARRGCDAPHYTLTVRAVSRRSQPAQTQRRSQGAAAAGRRRPTCTFPEVQRATLSNGLEGDAARAARDAARQRRAGGRRRATPPTRPARPALASLALDLLDDGTTTRDTFRIADELDALGARIVHRQLARPVVRAAAARCRPSSCPSLDVWPTSCCNPSFPQTWSTLEQKRAAGADRPGEGAAGRRRAAHAAARCSTARRTPTATRSPGPATRRRVAALTRDDLVAWHRAWFQPGQRTLIVTGDVTMAALKPELERAFGAWPSGHGAGQARQPVAAPAGGRVYLIDKPGRAAVGDRGRARLRARRAARGSRDRDRDAQLRRHRDVAPEPQPAPGQALELRRAGRAAGRARASGRSIVLAPVQTDKTKESMVEIAKELRDVAGERPIAGEEFASIMRNQTLGLPGRFETLDALESAAVQLVNSATRTTTSRSTRRACGRSTKRHSPPLAAVHPAERDHLAGGRRPGQGGGRHSRPEVRRGHAARSMTR